MNRIIAVVRDFVPPDKLDEMLARVEGSPVQYSNAEASGTREGLRDYDPDLVPDDDDDEE